jgi:hypothetical protein
MINKYRDPSRTKVQEEKRKQTGIIEYYTFIIFKKMAITLRSISLIYENRPF